MSAIKTQVGGTCGLEGCGKAHWARGFCKAHHQWRWKRGLLPANDVSVREKIEFYATPVTESGCWLWLGVTNNNGYGRVSVAGGKSEYSHRASYKAYVGPIAAGLHVCHKCDTPSCCNPAHLFLGTAEVNMRDAARKGRTRTVPRLGADHHNAKFTVEQVSEIRASNEASKVLAARYGCCVETILRARRNKGTYRNVP